jgi:voltage-gated potassium channel
MKLAGTDAVICPHLIGGMRMASEMVRPTVVSFLDMMLRDTEKNLRVEEIGIPDSFAGKELISLNLKKYRNIVLLAMKSDKDWIYNPPEDHVIKSNEVLVIMTTPEEGQRLESVLDAAEA